MKAVCDRYINEVLRLAIANCIQREANELNPNNPIPPPPTITNRMMDISSILNSSTDLLGSFFTMNPNSLNTINPHETTSSNNNSNNVRNENPNKRKQGPEESNNNNNNAAKRRMLFRPIAKSAAANKNDTKSNNNTNKDPKLTIAEVLAKKDKLWHTVIPHGICDLFVQLTLFCY